MSFPLSPWMRRLRQGKGGGVGGNGGGAQIVVAIVGSTCGASHFPAATSVERGVLGKLLYEKVWSKKKDVVYLD